MTRTVHYTYDASRTVLNWWRALRISIVTGLLYLVARFLIEHDAPFVLHVLGMGSLVALVQWASGTPFRLLSLALTCVTDGPDRPAAMTDAACQDVMRIVDQIAQRTVHTSTLPFAYARVEMQIDPVLFAEILSGASVEIPMLLSMTDDVWSSKEAENG